MKTTISLIKSHLDLRRQMREAAGEFYNLVEAVVTYDTSRYDALYYRHPQNSDDAEGVAESVQKVQAALDSIKQHFGITEKQPENVND